MLTNVNNASVVTACLPEEHGIISDFFFDPRAGESALMESAELLLRPKLFQRAGKLGLCTALVTAKDKIRTWLSRGFGRQAGAPFCLRDRAAAEHVLPTVNYWIFRAATCFGTKAR